MTFATGIAGHISLTVSMKMMIAHGHEIRLQAMCQLMSMPHVMAFELHMKAKEENEEPKEEETMNKAMCHASD